MAYYGSRMIVQDTPLAAGAETIVMLIEYPKLTRKRVHSRHAMLLYHYLL